MTDQIKTDGPYQDALSAEEIERRIMDSAFPKTSMEWWARGEIEKLRAHIAKLKAAIEPFRRVKGITSVYEYVPVEALRDDEWFNFRMNGAEMKTIYALLNGAKNDECLSVMRKASSKRTDAVG